MKLSEANTLVLVYLGKFALYAIAPILISSYLLNDPFVSAIVERGLWYLVFAFIAGALGASMDTVDEHFDSSIFKNLNPKFWDNEISWRNKYIGGDRDKGRTKFLGVQIPAIFTDAWHGFKGLHTIFFCLTVIFFVSVNHNSTVDYLLVDGFNRWVLIFFMM